MKTKLFFILLTGLFCTNLHAQLLDIDLSYSSAAGIVSATLTNKTDGIVLVTNADEHDGSRVYITCFDVNGRIIYDDWVGLDVVNLDNWTRIPFRSKNASWNYSYNIREILQKRGVLWNNVYEIRLKFWIHYVAQYPPSGMRPIGLIDREVHLRAANDYADTRESPVSTGIDFVLTNNTDYRLDIESVALWGYLGQEYTSFIDSRPGAVGARSSIGLPAGRGREVSAPVGTSIDELGLELCLSPLSAALRSVRVTAWIEGSGGSDSEVLTGDHPLLTYLELRGSNSLTPRNGRLTLRIDISYN